MAVRLLALAIIVAGVWAQDATIGTIAGGGGTSSYNGDHGPAKLATLNGPFGLAVDAAGDVFFVDCNNSAVRRIDGTTGIITTVAGTGTAGSSGDGGLAIQATLRSPTMIALDASGNLYIVDNGNYRVRKVTASTGVISTIAGTGTSATSGDGGAATAANLTYPYGVAIDAAANVYISDYRYNVIRKITYPSGIITTIAGFNGAGLGGDGGLASDAQLMGPSGLAFDPSGNLLICEQGAGRIRKITTATGIISTVAGTGTGAETSAGDGGSALAATFDQPNDVAVNSAGDIFITDTFADRIRRVDHSTGLISTICGTGTPGFSGDGGGASLAAINIPFGVACDAAGSIYISDFNNERVRKVTQGPVVMTTVSATPTPVIGTMSTLSVLGGSVAGEATLTYKWSTYGTPPAAVAFSATGSNAAKSTVATFSATGTYWLECTITDASSKTATSLLPIVVEALVSPWITTVAGGGIATGDGGPALQAALSSPNGVAIDAAGNQYVCELTNNRVREISAITGAITTVIGTGAATSIGDGGPAAAASVNEPAGVLIDGAGNLYVAEYSGNRIRKIAVGTGIVTTVAGTGTGGFAGDGGLATSAWLYQPDAIALDASGNLLIADYGNMRIRKIAATTGIITTIAGVGLQTTTGDGGAATAASLNGPSTLALDAAGNIYIAELTGHRIRKITAATGAISTVVGTGNAGSTGDGQAPTLALINAPNGVMIDAAGNILVCEFGGNRIRKVDIANSIIFTVSGSGIAQESGDNGPANLASISAPSMGAFDAAGDRYVADRGNNCIRKITDGPVIVTAATATPATTATTQVQLSVLGGDERGESTITYTWSASGTPPAAVGFTGNGGNAAKAMTATFTKPGAYALLCTLKDATGRSVATPVLNVTAAPTATSLAIAPATMSIPPLASGQFTANVLDQFGGALPTTPGAVAWSISGGPAIAATTGIVTAGSSAGGPYTITAQDGVAKNTASVTVSAGASAPTVATAAKATPNPVTGTSTALSVLGASSLGESTLSYQWAAIGTVPAAVSFSANGTNAAKASQASFTVGGTYTLQVSIIDPNKVLVASSVSVVVTPTLTSIAVSPASANVVLGGSQPYSATALDQFGKALAAQPAITWTTTGGTLSASGVFTPGTATGGPYTISASAGSGPTVGKATATVVNPPPTVATAASATPNPVQGTTTALSVLGADYAGEANLTYTWSTSGSAGVQFSPNGNNAAKSSTATFIGAGIYPITCTIANSAKLSVPSTVSVSVLALNKPLIATLAGTHAPGLVGNGDGGSAYQAALGNTVAAAVDASGTVYSCETAGNRVRAISATSGIITTLIGNGISESIGDGGAASAAAIDAPDGIAIDSAGNIYVAEAAAVRRIMASSGQVYTYAGGSYGFSGDGGAATSATLHTPQGLALDAAGNLYIADSGNNRVRKVTASTGVITTVAGNGAAITFGDGGPATAASVHNPSAVAVDAAGNLYIAESLGQVVRKVTAGTGIISTFAGTGVAGFAGDGGPAAAAQISGPMGLAFDAAGDLVISESSGNRLRWVDAHSGDIVTWCGNGSPGSIGDGALAANAQVSGPGAGMFDAAGTFFFSDAGNNRVRMIAHGPIIATQAVAAPNPVTGKSATLSVLGASEQGESGLTYTWSAISTIPAGLPVTFAGTNGTNAGKSGSSTFTAVGSYTLACAITDAASRKVAASLPITVAVTPTVITIAPSGATIGTNAQITFQATATDQFGASIFNPTFLWTASGGQNIGITTGIFAAGATPGGPYTITAATGGTNASTTVTVVTSHVPTVAVAAAASPNPTSGISTNLSVLGADALGEANLTYTWSCPSLTANLPGFSLNGTNAAKSSVATFLQIGVYPLQVTITNPSNLSVTSTVTVTVQATPTSAVMQPATASLASGASQAFTATACDQFGAPLATQPIFLWSATGGASVSPGGLFTASIAEYGTSTVLATSGTLSCQSVVAITAPPPTVATAAAVSPSPMTGPTAACSVLGADVAGESTLTYTWMCANASVSFVPNGTNTAKATVATLGEPDGSGAYDLEVTITNAAGLSVISTLNAPYKRTVNSIAVTPATQVLAVGGKQTFAATAWDQFGSYLTPQPAFSWTAPSGGTLSGATFTATTAGGPYTVTAAVTGIAAIGTASVSVDPAPVLPLNINFEPSTSAVPTGYLADTGLVFAARGNGWTYGWNIDHSDYVRQRGINANPLLDTLCQFHVGGQWKVALPNGFYTVFASIGDPGFASSYTLNVAGVPYWTNAALGVNQFASMAKTVAVNSGVLVVDCGAAIDKATRLDYLTISANAAPTVATAAAASPSTVTTTSTKLSVLGADDAGEPNLTYTWSATGSPPATPAFSANGTNAAKSCTATFSASGSYALQCLITDAGGLKVISSIAVTVSQTATALTVLPAAATIPLGGAEQFAASVNDQFGLALHTQPTVTWVASTGSAVTSGGLFTASATGSEPVTASSGSLKAMAAVTVSAASPLPVKIKFDPAPGQMGSYLVDGGWLFGNRGNGWVYGWSAPETDAFQGATEANTLYASDIRFHAGAHWQIALPNGTYAVLACIGDGAKSTTDTLNVQGVS